MWHGDRNGFLKRSYASPFFKSHLSLPVSESVLHKPEHCWLVYWPGQLHRDLPFCDA